MAVYYNEIEPSAIAWLKAAMDAGYIAKGDVDTRSITEVPPDDLRYYTQCHFFAGIGGWSIALRQAMWPDDRPVWTGSCPCQPFSAAGQRQGQNDERHLWPVWGNLIAQCRPAIVFGEQVASAIAFGWLDEAFDDLEAENYACAAAVLPACSVGAPHRRDRLWFVAQPSGNDASGEAGELPAQKEREEEGRPLGECNPEPCCSGTMGNTEHNGRNATTQPGSNGTDDDRPQGTEGTHSAEQSQGAGASEYVADSFQSRLEGHIGHEPRRGEPGRQQAQPDGSACAGDSLKWVECPDGKQRPVESGLCLLADGIPGRLRKAALHGFGNAIHPHVAAEFIKATGGAL